MTCRCEVMRDVCDGSIASVMCDVKGTQQQQRRCDAMRVAAASVVQCPVSCIDQCAAVRFKLSVKRVSDSKSNKRTKSLACSLTHSHATRRDTLRHHRLRRHYTRTTHQPTSIASSCCLCCSLSYSTVRPHHRCIAMMHTPLMRA